MEAACKDGNVDKIALLLKAGADVNKAIDGKSAIRIVSEGKQAETALPCVKLLVDAGAKPDDEWKKDSYRNAPTAVRELLLEKFTIPESGKESEITLLVDKSYSLQALSIATRTGDSTIPELGPWLLAHHTEIQNFPSDEGAMLHWAIWRKGENGAWAKQEVDFKTSEALPELRWGDVVTCSVERREAPVPTNSHVQPPPRPAIQRDGLPKTFLWHLRKRISFPITVETDGKSREIQVRGDRLFFDPTKDEVPQGSVQQIAGHLWQRDLITLQLPFTIVVSRKGWPDVLLAYGSKEARKFQLAPGDRLKLEVSDEMREKMAVMRGRLVTVNVEGYPFARRFGDRQDDRILATSFPTLIQALVEMQSPLDQRWLGLAEKQTLERSNLMVDNDYFPAFTLLPHPDLSRIRIRRLLETGGEKVIEVDLAKAIAADGDAKKADIALQAADVVEISLLKERPSGPWKGYSAKENAFFAKALAGQVQIVDSEGGLAMREIDYHAPRFRETEIGWIPLPGATGVPSALAWWFYSGSDIEIKRGGVTEKNTPYTTFLRDGDEIRSAPAEQPQQPVQPVQRTMRPRSGTE